MSIRIENLTKRFKADSVLDDVSFEVPAGETLVLFGPSGAGKTVLLRCIAGAVEADEGSVWLNGKDATDLPPEDRGLGMAFQNFALFPHMSAEQNIASPLEARRIPKAGIASGVRRVAELLKIDHVLDHAPRELSNGQKQRTALARALVAAPDLLLLDDPLRNVDAKLRFEMRLELPRLLADRGATVIYVTQDYKEAMALGQTVAVLDGGRIAQIGTPEDIYLRPASRAISRLFGDPTINLLDVTPEVDERGVFVSLSGHRVPLSPGYEEAVGRSAVLGLRPEAVLFAETGFPVQIEAETPLNEKTITLTTTARGREVFVSRPAGAPGPSGDKAYLTVEGAATLLFDKATGARIEPASGADEVAA
ncbi:ABC transporter ATP-binding protein [Ruegeria sp. 2205SS24-7]|uniref:ABC transporter ATP-binding protein n=1 Tax=Ruegeria discodermiae TaxID=3064389 RepID=UPI002740EECE|nr:ABC transporter ATP-binding protein [Ruegeria sp. 2205SS24-7]MDP5220968.1 ABC transporter ATP-binding protein [Ruegeria sp. 2205SS24-7]